MNFLVQKSVASHSSRALKPSKAQNFTKLLYIKIRVTSGELCKCKNKYVEKLFFQKLTLIDKGGLKLEIDEKNTDAKIVDGDFGKGDHGGWPE